MAGKSLVRESLVKLLYDQRRPVEDVVKAIMVKESPC